MSKANKTNSEDQPIEEILRRSYSFDQYSRYETIKKIIDSLRLNGDKLRILDVGGRGNKLKKFLPEDEVYYLDPFVDEGDENYIIGNGCSIPEMDNAFEYVTSADVFEHIPKINREKFLEEGLRVCSDALIVAAPFRSKNIDYLENQADSNFQILSGGEQHLWLKEHIENGLPSKNEIEKFINKKGLKYIVLNNNELNLWYLMINLSFFISYNYTKEIESMSKELNHFFNSNIYQYDFNVRGESYRKIYIIFKKKNRKIFFDNINHGDLPTELYRELLSKIFQIVYQSNYDLNDHIKNLENQTGLDALKRIDELENEIMWINKSRIWKLRNYLSKIISSAVLDSLIDKARSFLLNIKNDGLRVAIFNLATQTFDKRIHEGFREYQKWILENEQNIPQKRISDFSLTPKISVLVPVYNVDQIWLNKCIASVMSQSYQNWELCLYDDFSTNQETIKCLRQWEDKDERIKIKYGKKNINISGASNKCIEMSTGEYLAFLDNDDELSLNALEEIVNAINVNNDAEFIYSDEDKITVMGRRFDPYFKPDWSPEMLLSQMYTCHLSVYRKDIIQRIGGFRKGYDGSQDYDLILRASECIKPDNIIHIPKILYHWRTLETSTSLIQSAKSYTLQASKRALSDYILRNNIKGKVTVGEKLGTFRVIRSVVGSPKVTIIIPFKDKVDLLKKCVESILSKTTYKNYEIFLINNKSVATETREYLTSLESDPRVRVYRYDRKFNFSAINNYAVSKSNSDFVLLLNNDTEVINPDWLTALLEQAQVDGVGVVGAKLLYPNNTIQHAGVIMGLGIAGHAFKHQTINKNSYFSNASIVKNYCAVTGACLLVSKKLFESVGGLDESNLPIAYNDVDFCLKVLESGYRVVYTPYAILYHYESVSRGSDVVNYEVDPKKYRRVIAEREYMEKKWGKYILNDPYYNPNLTRIREDFSYRFINDEKI